MTDRGSRAAAGDSRGATVHVRTRWDDCDRNGHVNNAAYPALVRVAHDRAGLPEARLRALTIGYREPIGPETTIEAEVALLADGGDRIDAQYTFRSGGRVAAAAKATWDRSGGARGTEPPGNRRPSFELPAVARDAGGRPFRLRQSVRSYEVGPDDAARPQAILQWLEHAVFRAAARSGWPTARMEAAGFLSLVIEHRLVLGEPAREGDELEVESRLVELRRVSGVWHHEVRNLSGALVAADRARGAFLDLAGRIRPAPGALLDALLRGEPDE